MPVNPASIETQNAILDGWLRASGRTYQLEGWIDNPLEDDAQEADFPGYTPATLADTDWSAASGGEIETATLHSLGTPSGAGTDGIRFWALRDTTLDEIAYVGALERTVYMSASSDPLQIRPTVPYGGRDD